jgi:predicted phage tail protein
MENTLFLAQLLGSFSVILAVVIILRRKLIVHVVSDFLTNRTLAFIVGALEVLAGLVLVIKHSAWNGALETVISMLGWLLLLEGIFYLFATKRVLRKLIQWLDNKSAYYFFALLYLILGVYLVYVGFGLNI